MKKITCITGPKNSGKTTFARSLIKEFLLRDIQLNGILAPGHYALETKDGFDLELIPGNDRFHFISVQQHNDWIPCGRFWINPDALCKGRTHLLAKNTGKTPMIIDELGPLELKGQLWSDPVKKLLDKAQCPWMIWIVRDRCLTAICEYFKIQPAMIVKSNDCKPAAAVEQLLELFQVNK